MKTRKTKINTEAHEIPGKLWAKNRSQGYKISPKTYTRIVGISPACSWEFIITETVQYIRKKRNVSTAGVKSAGNQYVKALLSGTQNTIRQCDRRPNLIYVSTVWNQLNVTGWSYRG